MAKHLIKHLRTLALVGQAGSGKTSLAEALLARAGAIPAAGSIERLGPSEPEGPQRLCCTCAPVRDYSGREVARVGLFAHRADDRGLDVDFPRTCRELARQISVRLGHLPAATMSVTA